MGGERQRPIRVRAKVKVNPHAPCTTLVYTLSRVGPSRQTRDVDPKPIQSRASVADGSPTPKHYRANAQRPPGASRSVFSSKGH